MRPTPLLLGLVISISVSGAEPPRRPSAPTGLRVTGSTPPVAIPVRHRVLARGSELMGMRVTNAQDEELGKVDDLVVDLEAGLVLKVIVASNGAVGDGARVVGAPPSAFTANVAGKKLRLKDNLPGPLESLERSKTGTLPAPGPGYVDKASRLIGLPLTNLQGEGIGTIEDLILDLEIGRILEVSVCVRSFPGVGVEATTLPPTALRYDGSGAALYLALASEMNDAPHFEKSLGATNGSPPRKGLPQNR